MSIDMEIHILVMKKLANLLDILKAHVIFHKNR